jgi:ankyrin repeat protein
MDLSIKDNRGSTPLHWACYSKSEIAMCYILSWTQNLNEKDIEGFTPLHLAVRSVDALKSSRPVRSLLIRGASRDIVDNNDRNPMVLAD